MSVKQQKFINDKLTKIVKSFLDGLDSKGVHWSLPYVQSGMPRKLHNGQKFYHLIELEDRDEWREVDFNNFHPLVEGVRI